MIIFTLIAAIIVFAIIQIPGIIAFKRKHKYRWVIAVLCLLSLIPGTFWFPWVAALIWSIWPKATP